MSTTQSNVTRYSLIAAFGGFVFGLDLLNISGAIRFISAQFGLTDNQQGMVIGATFWGVMGVLFFAGTLCEKFGRKRVLLSIALAYTVSTLMSAFATSYEMLLVGRFIGGAAFASLTVSAMYIGEVAPADQRGKFVSVNQLMIALGIFVTSVVNYYLLQYLSQIEFITEANVWRFMLGSELIANVIWVALLLGVPESPRWLLKKGKDEQAKLALNKMMPAEQIDAFVVQVKESFHNQSDSSTLTQLKNLFCGRMSWIIAIAVVYAVVQGGTGMNAVLSFAPMVFEQVGMSTQDSFMQTVIMAVVNLAAVFIAIFTVEKLGRRKLTLGGLALVVLAHSSIWFGFKDTTYVFDQAAYQRIQTELTGQAVDLTKLANMVGQTYQNDVALKAALAERLTNNELPLASGSVINQTINGIKPLAVVFGIFAFIAAFNLSIGPIMWVIFSEIFPNNVRSIGLAFAALVQTVSSWAVSQLFPWSLSNFGAANVFLMYAFIGLGGLIIMFLILPETKGKSIEQLEKDLVKKGKDECSMQTQNI
ncbi:sugar transporter [Catenovulum agarivorans DS-2]|uniref:Sugar transporter n=1 Tax=Catenovulum agarivorans DS-2 TaxID=1328313 RepID=W7QEA4_9ALTE|nr:MFS transporter [Catenovulum agarivorans]EWH10256.1 sugar transporter [Catenovulum agarivorans DS-2]